MESNQLLKSKDVARILNISLPLAYRLLENGDIKAIRFGRTVRCRPEDLDTFLANHQSSDHIFTNTNPDNSHE